MVTTKMIKKVIMFSLIIQAMIAYTVFAADTSLYNRIAGNDRYKTAVAQSQRGWDKSDYAVLVNGEVYADALCAGPLAKKYNAPILLTQSNILNSETIDELKRLEVKHILVIGGTGAISADVEGELKKTGFTDIERIYGQDRYETSANVAERIGSSDNAVIVSGESYADALSISVEASNKGMPVLLTQKKKLPDAVRYYLLKNDIKKTYIIGGKGVIDESIEKYLPSAERLAGKDRYETNTIVLQRFAGDFKYDRIYIAVGDGPTGKEFADALTSTALACQTFSPVLLTNHKMPDGTERFIKANLNLNSEVIGLGGSAVVPDELIKQAMDDKITVSVEKVFDVSGIYGNDDTTTEIKGDATVSAANTTIKNTVINGDLLIASTVNDGDVYLDKVTIKGSLIVNGGGMNSIHVDNSTSAAIKIDKPTAVPVRIVTEVPSILIKTDSIIERNEANNNEFSNVAVCQSANAILKGNFDKVEILDKNTKVSIENGIVKQISVDESAKNSVITVAQNSIIQSVSVKSDAVITGKGEVAKVSVDSQNTNILIKTGKVGDVIVAENAKYTNIDVDKDTTVNRLTVSGQGTTITGQGNVEKAVVNAGDVQIEKKPVNVEIKTGIAAIIEGQQTTGVPVVKTGSNNTAPQAPEVPQKPGAPQAGSVTVIQPASGAAEGQTMINIGSTLEYRITDSAGTVEKQAWTSGTGSPQTTTSSPVLSAGDKIEVRVRAAGSIPAGDIYTYTVQSGDIGLSAAPQETGTAVVEGKVQKADGSDNAGVAVTLTGKSDQNNNINMSVSSDAGGNFSFTDVPAGDYTVTVAVDGYYINTEIVRVEDGQTLSLSSIMKLFVKGPAGNITGTAKYVGSGDNSGIYLKVQTASGAEMPNCIALTDSDGNFVINNIPIEAGQDSSTYILTAYPLSSNANFVNDSMTITVTKDATTAVGNTLWIRTKPNGVIVLADDITPWEHNAPTEMLTSIGVDFTVYDSSQLDSLSIPLDKVVMILNDQPQAFYDAYAANQQKIDDFVSNGGTLLFEACDGGWNGGSIESAGATLPGGVINRLTYAEVNNNANPTHPMMQGIPSILNGNSASHDYFINLPDVVTVLTTDSTDNPTLVEYKYGMGRVISTGQPLEFYWGSGNPLENIYKALIYYTFDLPMP